MKRLWIPALAGTPVPGVMRCRVKVFAVVLAIFTIGCAKHVTVYPPVNNSLGYPVFQALGEINRAPLHVGLILEPKLKDEKIRVTRELGTAEIAIGEVLSSKLIQALSYKFERISLVTDSKSAPSLLLTIGLEGEGPVVGVDVNTYSHLLSSGGTFEVVAKIDARLVATLRQNGQSVWVGHARLTQEMLSGGAAYGITEGSAQAAELTNRLSDLLVADLMLQMQKSGELKKFLVASSHEATPPDSHNQHHFMCCASKNCRCSVAATRDSTEP